MTENNVPPSKRIEFPLQEIDLALADAIFKMPAPAKWPAVNAIRHLNRAWRLRQLDPQMAYFRSITAEEEAATCLFLTLKRLKYPGSENIQHRNHLHKNALFPFLIAVSRMLAKHKTSLPSTGIYLDSKASPPRMFLQFQIAGVKGYWAPQPPLNLSIAGGPQGGQSRAIDFSAEIVELAQEHSVASILSHLRERANLRNRLLYAGATGYPDVEGDAELTVKRFQRNVFLMLKLYLLIEPYERQLFVQQCLDAFLRMLGHLPQGELLEE